MRVRYSHRKREVGWRKRREDKMKEVMLEGGIFKQKERGRLDECRSS